MRRRSRSRPRPRIPLRRMISLAHPRPRTGPHTGPHTPRIHLHLRILLLQQPIRQPAKRVRAARARALAEVRRVEERCGFRRRRVRVLVVVRIRVGGLTMQVRVRVLMRVGAMRVGMLRGVLLMLVGVSMRGSLPM